MRHRKKGRKLGRTASHKKALLRNLAAEIIEHKEIRTTVAKAKEMRSTMDRLITYAKKGELHHRRLAFAFLRNKTAVHTLFEEIGPAFNERSGGYSRVLRLGQRKGDGAEIALFQLVGFEKLGEVGKPTTRKKKAKKSKAETAGTSTAEKVKEQTADESETAGDKKPEELETAAEVATAGQSAEKNSEAETETAESQKDKKPAAETAPADEEKAEVEPERDEKKDKKE